MVCHLIVTRCFRHVSQSRKNDASDFAPMSHWFEPITGYVLRRLGKQMLASLAFVLYVLPKWALAFVLEAGKQKGNWELLLN